MENRETLKQNFISSCRLGEYSIEALRKDASFRTYDRIKCDGKSYILMNAPPLKENVVTFLETGKIFADIGLSTPHVYKQDIENGFLLLEDFGNATFKNVIEHTETFQDYPDQTRIYERAIDVLIHIHKNSDNAELKHYNEDILINESMLFIEWYISVLNGEKIEDSQKETFSTILRSLFKHLENFPKVLVHRDFHAENLFWLDERSSINKVGIIDFQDAVLGCPAYDVVSLLEDARREVPEKVVINSISRYLKAFPEYTRKDFMAAYAILSAQRNLKIIGIFTRQATKNKNPHYLVMLPLVWSYVHNSLKHPLLLPLKNWLNEVLPNQSNQKTTRSIGEKILA